MTGGHRLNGHAPAFVDASPRQVHDAEHIVVGSLFRDPGLLESVQAVGLAPRDFADSSLGLVYGAQVACDARMGDVYEHLQRQGTLDRVGGPATIAELDGGLASTAMALPSARLVVRAARMRKLRDAYGRAHRGDDYSPDEIRKLEESLLDDLATDGPAVDFPVGFVGARLEAIRERPEPQSPLPGLLDPEPGLHVLVGEGSRGKTTFGLYLALCWATGASPWDRAPCLPGGRALVVSREQNVTRLDRRARELDTCAASKIGRDAWTRKVSMVARDPELDSSLRPLLQLDAAGVARLDEVLTASHEAGEPYRFVLLDSLSRLKPPGTEENDNDAMSAFLDALQELAERHGAWIVLIHHAGKGESRGTRQAPRGASAIDAVAQGTWVMEDGDLPFQRKVKIHGNALQERTLEFTVSNETDPGKVLFWRIEEPGAGHVVEDYLAPGDRVTVPELARLLFENDHQRARVQAKRVAQRWHQGGVATFEESEGKGKPAWVMRPTEALEGDDAIPF